MIGKLYYLASSVIVLLGAFAFLSPVLINADLVYPERVDSLYLRFHSQGPGSDTLSFNPSDAGLEYETLLVPTMDGYFLQGWYINAEDSPAITVIILHDLNEGKIMYIDPVRQLADRGFNVAVFDQRAHGESGGREFSPGLPAVDDLKRVVDTVIARNETRHIVFFGKGLGAAIALQASVFEERCHALVLQSPFHTYEAYINRSVDLSGKSLKAVWRPVLKRKAGELLQYPMEEFNLREIAAYTTLPVLFIAGSDDEKILPTETLRVFDAAATEKKELFLVRDAGHDDIATTGGEKYYNRIASFLNTMLPREQKPVRLKKLAFNDF